MKVEEGEEGEEEEEGGSEGSMRSSRCFPSASCNSSRPSLKPQIKQKISSNLLRAAQASWEKGGQSSTKASSPKGKRAACVT
jgi:hypothetical protein